MRNYFHIFAQKNFFSDSEAKKTVYYQTWMIEM